MHIFKNPKKAFFAAFIYLFAEYRLGGVFIRCAVGEILSFMFLPIIIIPTIEYNDTLMLRKWVAPIYAVLSILLSHIWFPINVDGIENAFQDESFMGLSNFPAQRFFMCSGIWQSDDMYVVFMLITIVFGSVFYVGCKRKWFIELDNAGL